MGLEQILFANIVLPFLRGVGQGGMSEIYAWLEGNGVKLGHGLGGRLRRRISGGRLGVGDREQLAGELATYVAKHPDATVTLAAAALQDAQREGDRLDVLREVLAALFELAKEARRPVVLPGFVTGTDHLAIIDVRTSVEKGPYEVPQVYAVSGDEVRTITLARKGGPEYGPRPRVWLVTKPEDGELERLEAEAQGAGPVIGNGDPFTQSMKGRPLVTRITLDAVRVTVPTVTPLGLMINADTEAIEWASGSDWMLPAFQRLRARAAARDEDLAEMKATFAAALA
jgi:hypothetical protein